MKALFPASQSLWLLLGTALLLLALLVGLWVPLLDVDAAQYGGISLEILETGNWLQITNRHVDYLDKPPLLFWLSAASFHLFGTHDWAYKLPSFLFALLAIFSTYRLGELLYDRKTGQLAAMLVLSSLCMFIMTNDVRTDTLLLGSTTFSIWQILLFVRTKRWMALVLGFVGIGLGMLAKGPLGLMMPLLALSSEFAYKRQWVNFFRWQWLVGLTIVCLLLLPMCYGLYQQFDLHPEKIIQGNKGVSGLKFYFWTQSFGRLTGESDWGTKFDNGAGPFFFTHTFLWVFFPWMILTIGGLWKTVWVLVRSRFKPGYFPELLTFGGFVLTFIALSASRYKLPHYIYILAPVSALLAARFWLHDLWTASRKGLQKVIGGMHLIFGTGAIILSGLMLFYFFPGASWIVIVIWIILLVIAVVSIFRFREQQQQFYPLLFALAAFYFVANAHYYPRLMRYQSTYVAGELVQKNAVPHDAFFMTGGNLFEFSLDYYSRRTVPSIETDSTHLAMALQRQHQIWMYTDSAGREAIRKTNFPLLKEYRFDHYGVQFITVNFLRPETRPATLRERWLIVIGRNTSASISQ
jgi:4-amino-4-deoxy-L-arabinose transferase-like glycosyltransferase